MPVVAVLGAQWGDEGKGRVVDLLAAKAKMVVRSGGGTNAGHTVINHLGTFKLHLVPAGIFDPNVVNVIGAGTVVDPAALLKELATLKEAGISTDNLFISERAHVVMPYHLQLDGLEEDSRGANEIGTTRRGIGPTYVDKASRVGIRMGDLIHEETLLSRMMSVLEQKNKVLTKLYGAQPITAIHDTYLQYLQYGRQLEKHIISTHAMIQEALRRDVPLLIEGNQGALLDIDHGTFPFVTSTATGSAGACQGAGIPPTRLNGVVGIYKAYSTRVGAGPYPTELKDEVGDKIRADGKEYGTTTGRPRRVGWFDAVAARYAAEINGISSIALTKLDVLDGIERIKICTGYKLHDTQLDTLPSSVALLNQVEPIYEEYPGWMTSTSNARSIEDLPEAAQRYVRRLSQVIGARLGMISVGPSREQVITLQEIF
ncbi:MAG TPA: adenylosuccinate synthase [Herpetosiphonaceae bacterium]|nr:adenylosuccinate synthase [Herpetosiphonaceae bacterium]